MDRNPGGCPSDSINHCDFSADEILVATTLSRLNFLIPLYEFRKWGFLPPLWGSKRLRAAYAPDRPRTESVVATACPVISVGGNLRNISPDSPLLLKASPTSDVGAQGIPGIVAEPPQGKEEKTERRNFKKVRTESEELPLQVDFSRTIRGQPHGLPNGGADASSGSPPRAARPMLLFDLNLMPPDCSGIQSPLPNENETPRPPPSDCAVADNGSNEAQATGAVRQKRFGDIQGEMPQGCCIGHQGTEPRFRQAQ